MDSVIKILIVDDHPIVRDGLEHILHKEEDMHTAPTRGRGTAIAAINQHTPDIAIVDISLKGEKSGLELTKKIHSLYPNFRC
jgi:DNA-binding NarL/FixJ family response regulator